MECPECGRSISDKAADCPHCGTSVRSLTVGSQGTDDGDEDATVDDVAGDDEADPDPESGSGPDPPSDDADSPPDEAVAESVADEDDGQSPEVDDSDQTEGDADGAPAAGGPDAEEPPHEDQPSDGQSSREPPSGGDPERGERPRGSPPGGQGSPPEGQGSPPEGQDRQGSQPQDSGPQGSAPKEGGPQDQPAGGPQGAPPQDQGAQGQPPQGQPPQGQGTPAQDQGARGPPQQGQGPPPQGGGAQGPPPRGQDAQSPPPQGQGASGSPPQGQGPQGQPPQGQGPQGQPPQGQGAAGQPAPAGGPGGPATGHGGGFGGGGHSRSLGDRIRALPLQTGALAGAGAGLLMFVLGAILAVAYPSDVTAGDLSTLDFTVMTLFDLQFVPPGNNVYHVTTAMNGHFDEFFATEGVFGLLYVVPALILYRVGKLVARLHGTDDLSLQDSALTGASIVLGYLPIMLIAAIIGTSDPFEIELGTAVFLPGLVYPVLFGGIGGLLASYYYPGELRAGMGYAVAVSVVSFLLVFISTLVTVEEIPDGASEMTGRLITTFFAWVGALSLNLDADGVGLLPYAILIGLFLAAGILRVERGPDLKSPVEAFASGASLATSFVVLAAILFSIAAVLYSVVLTGNDLQDAFLVVGQAAQDDALGGDYWKTFTEIGTYAENLLIATVVYPVVVSGCGGAALWWARNRDTQEEYQQQGQPPQQPPQQPRR